MTGMQVEEVKTALLLHGPRTSQTTKDVLADIHKLRTVSNGQTCSYLCTVSYERSGACTLTHCSASLWKAHYLLKLVGAAGGCTAQQEE